MAIHILRLRIFAIGVKNELLVNNRFKNLSGQTTMLKHFSVWPSIAFPQSFHIPSQTVCTVHSFQRLIWFCSVCCATTPIDHLRASVRPQSIKLLWRPLSKVTSLLMWSYNPSERMAFHKTTFVAAWSIFADYNFHSRGFRGDICSFKTASPAPTGRSSPVSFFAVMNGSCWRRSLLHQVHHAQDNFKVQTFSAVNLQV